MHLALERLPDPALGGLTLRLRIRDDRGSRRGRAWLQWASEPMPRARVAGSLRHLLPSDPGDEIQVVWRVPAGDAGRQIRAAVTLIRHPGVTDHAGLVWGPPAAPRRPRPHRIVDLGGLLRLREIPLGRTRIRK
jgi:hypothetical protein